MEEEEGKARDLSHHHKFIIKTIFQDIYIYIFVRATVFGMNNIFISINVQQLID